jgi:phospholipid transport system substrate-binding protein
MNRCIRLIAEVNRQALPRLAAACCLLMLAGPALAQPPEQLVREVADRVLNQVRSDPSLAADQGKIAAMVDREVTPYVDFQGICHKSLGRGYGLLSDVQRQEFDGLCKKIILNTYSFGLSQFRNIEVKVKPARALPNGDAVVHTIVSQEGDDDINVDYEMKKTPTGWLVTDVHIDGVSMISNLFSQFSAILRLDGVHELLSRMRTKLAHG